MATVSLEQVYHAELIDGREIQKPLPKKLHAFVQRFLLLALTRDLPGSYLALPELNVVCGEDRLVPDLTVASRRAQYRDGDLVEPPCFAIEIVSPGQTIAQLFDRAGRLCLAGTPLCWIIWPERRKAWQYSSEDLTEAKEILTAALPEGASVSIRLAEMWAELE